LSRGNGESWGVDYPFDKQIAVCYCIYKEKQMKQERLDEIKKELEKVMDFREGTDIVKCSVFGKYQGILITLTYYGDYSGIWIGKIDNDFKVELSTQLLECTVEIKESKILFRTRDCTIEVGE
jgi:hypothetical protein